MAPAVLTIFTKFGSNPTLGFPVVTSGTGNGASFNHHRRYSTRAQVRCAGRPSAVGSEEAVAASAEAAVGLFDSSAAFASGGLSAGLDSSAAVAFGGLSFGEDCAKTSPALNNHTPKIHSSPLRTGVSSERDRVTDPKDIRG